MAIDQKTTRIIKYNSVGLSLATIGKLENLHQTTIKARLLEHGIQPADTRRAFMEDVYDSLTPNLQTWLLSQMTPSMNTKMFVRDLLIKEFMNQKNPNL